MNILKCKCLECGASASSGVGWFRIYNPYQSSITISCGVVSSDQVFSPNSECYCGFCDSYFLSVLIYYREHGVVCSRGMGITVQANAQNVGGGQMILTTVSGYLEL